MNNENNIAGSMDLYDQNQKKDREVLKRRYSKGTSPIARFAALQVIEQPGPDDLSLADHHEIAKARISDALKKGRKDTAEAVRRQYMEDHMLPAIEVVVRASSPDEVVNGEYIQKMLDRYVIPAVGVYRGSGYTDQYVRTRYAEHLGGGMQVVSDHTVSKYMREINRDLDEGRVRTALSRAKKCKKMVDRGDALSSDPDYELLTRIVSYYGYGQ